jgi:hypothetical protein
MRFNWLTAERGMILGKRVLLSVLGLLLPAGLAQAAETPGFSRDVKPFLAQYCVECHNAKNAKAGVNLEDFRAVMKGGRKGAVVVPGQPDRSNLQLTMEGRGKVMPPRKYAQQPTRAEVAMVRVWVAAGAQEDSAAQDKDTGPQTRAPTHPSSRAALLLLPRSVANNSNRRRWFVLALLPGKRTRRVKAGDYYRRCICMPWLAVWWASSW